MIWVLKKTQSCIEALPPTVWLLVNSLAKGFSIFKSREKLQPLNYQPGCLLFLLFFMPKTKILWQNTPNCMEPFIPGCLLCTLGPQGVESLLHHCDLLPFESSVGRAYFQNGLQLLIVASNLCLTVDIRFLSVGSLVSNHSAPRSFRRRDRITEETQRARPMEQKSSRSSI